MVSGKKSSVSTQKRKEGRLRKLSYCSMSPGERNLIGAFFLTGISIFAPQGSAAVEQKTHNLQVGGSIPSPATTTKKEARAKDLVSARITLKMDFLRTRLR